MHSDAFDVIPFEDIKGNWKKLGSGSFGNVYRGTYLGIDVAIKEVLPSKDYDVAKYFEREWRLMKECRHPNICLFIGLSRAPPPDNRIFIVSEFIENGNVRLYIHDKSKAFPWKLRLSFATDVTRALAYLHARKCIHRDLKGENLLVTSNGRLKVTDFGFARIAARNEEESKRLTFCGTDSYMSPEILLGEGFDLPTDIFSLGIIFCEIGARRLADDSHFKRSAPTYGMDFDEVKRLMSAGCPDDFYSLCIECLSTNPLIRPSTRDVLERLQVIEAEVLLRPGEADDVHFGSVRFMTGGKPSAPRIPSFNVEKPEKPESSSEDSDDELAEAVMGLSNIGVKSAWTSLSDEPLLNGLKDNSEKSLSSILTIKPSPDPNSSSSAISQHSSDSDGNGAIPPEREGDPLLPGSLLSIATLDSYHTATSSIISSAYATEGGSTIRSLHANYVPRLVHRFSLLKPGAKQKRNGDLSSANVNSETAGWYPLGLIFSSGFLSGKKCDLCSKRIGWKPVLQCDDCGLRSHVKCGELAPFDCEIRSNNQQQDESPSLSAISPLSKVKQNAVNASEQLKFKR